MGGGRREGSGRGSGGDGGNQSVERAG
jgi:hypothetical protein